MTSATRLLTGLLAFAVAVSVVHYTDNFVNYDAYPQSGTLPNPPAWLVLGSWFLFTAFGIAGWLWFRRGEVRKASLCLAVYAGSGLVGFVHYSVAGATDLVWWRQTHIVIDIVCGIAILTFAVWAVRNERSLHVA